MISKLGGIVETITGFFQSLTQKGYLTMDYIFYIALGIELVLVVFFLIKSSYSYELRLDRSLDKLNKWLYYNQYIDENNLIDFNRRIKKAPKLLKYHWQQYMLYREHAPSHYMSNYNCIDKPLHTSSFTSNIKNLMSICWTLVVVAFLLNLTSYALVGSTNIGLVLINSLLAPVSIVLLNTFFSILLRSWQNSNLAGLYQNFHLFNRYIDKACTTLPEYIDFEILFTKEEIRRGIPVLNEYLEKRARQEQKELENAMLNSVEHEEYNFNELGVDGSQILDRAMKETEIFLNQRNRSLAEIQQLESEIESLKRNYENNQKEYQRKMQASKENVDRLRKQQEESTNRIESNYIRKQQSDEIKKQEQLEKDYESTTLRYNQELGALTTEIEVRRTELEDRRAHVEDSMKAEYKTFSNKMYKLLNNDLEEKNTEIKQKLIEEKDYYAQELQQTQMMLESTQAELDKLHNILANNGINIGDHGEFYDENLRKEEQKVKFGKNKKSKEKSETPQEPVDVPIEEPVVQETVEEPVTAQETSPIAVESVGQPALEETSEQPVVEEHKTEQTDEPVYDEFGGYYDNEGYYRYKNGTYYDPDGNYFDEFGGHYDKDGNYFPAEDNPIEQPVAEERVELVEEDLQQENNVETVEETTESAFEKENQETTDTDKQKPAGKRGRPKKITTNTENTKPKGKRGRPRKTTDERPAETKPKGKRGRPKKTETADTQDDTKPKGKRGRPKKTGTTSSSKKPAGKRGRPKKTITDSQTETKPKGKRGRPKKEVVTKSELFDELERLNLQIQEENEKLKLQQEELNQKIDETLSKIDDEKPENNDDNNVG